MELIPITKQKDLEELHEYLKNVQNNNDIDDAIRVKAAWFMLSMTPVDPDVLERVMKESRKRGQFDLNFDGPSATILLPDPISMEESRKHDE